jgi:hypothetical protein
MVYEKFTPKSEGEKVSRINSAGIINITLENLWRDGYSAIARGDLITWNRKLDSIWLILGGDVKPDSEEEREFMKIELMIFTTGSLGDIKAGFQIKSDEKKENRALQYLLLRKKSLFLRRLQNAQGKGTAYASDDDDDFD